MVLRRSLIGHLPWVAEILCCMGMFCLAWLSFGGEIPAQRALLPFLFLALSCLALEWSMR